MSRNHSTNFEPSLKELIKQARHQGYIRGLEKALSAAHSVDEGSALFAGCNLEGFIEALTKFIKEEKQRVSNVGQPLRS